MHSLGRFGDAGSNQGRNSWSYQGAQGFTQVHTCNTDCINRGYSNRETMQTEPTLHCHDNQVWLIVVLVCALEFRYSDLRDLLETEDPSLWKSVTKVMFEFDNSFSWSNNKYVELTWTRVKDAKHRTAQHGPPSMGAKVDRFTCASHPSAFLICCAHLCRSPLICSSVCHSPHMCLSSVAEQIPEDMSADLARVRAAYHETVPEEVWCETIDHVPDNL